MYKNERDACLLAHNSHRLFGMMILQACQYYSQYPDDSLLSKAKASMHKNFSVVFGLKTQRWQVVIVWQVLWLLGRHVVLT